MRKTFISNTPEYDYEAGEYIKGQHAETQEQAFDLAPWAAKIIEVECRFLAFESADDAATHKSQL